jgi:CheY-like chemotaxis protein/HPt (histidine-containing phosphotransfer) domain-containing protein
MQKIPKFLLSPLHEQPQERELAGSGIQACLRFPFRPSDLYNLLADDRHEPSADAAPESALPHARILLVEDNLINQRVFGRQLEMLGLEMIIRGDGLEGVEARIAGGIDLIMMDCQLPTIDGFEATRRIRNWELKTGARRLPIIAVTAHVMSGDAEACFQAGMDDYLPKPFDLVKLRRKLGQWLDHGEARAEEEAGGKEPLIARTLDSEQLGDCLTGNVEIDQELIGAALEEVGLRCAEVEKALQQNDEATWRSSVHQAVGTAATMGFVELAEHFRQAEAAAEWPQRERIFARLGPMTEKTRQALTALGLIEGGTLVGLAN